MIIIAAVILAVAALTELQVDQIIRIFEGSLHTMGEGVKTVWNLLSPALLAYLAYKQALNRKALDANTEVSKKAFEVANGHNEKISKAVEISEQVLTKIGNEPQKVGVVNTPQHPVPTSETP
jgi:hypothetical protein